MPRIKGKKGSSEKYFGEEQEKAVIDYLAATTQEEKNHIWTRKLDAPIKKLVTSIIQTYKNYDVSEEIVDLTFLHVYQQINSYKPEKGRSFSYLGTIAKHFYHNECKALYKKQSNSDDIHELMKTDELEIKLKGHYNLTTEDTEYDFIKGFIVYLIEKFRNEIDCNTLLETNEIKVGEALVIVLKTHDDIFFDDDTTPIKITRRGTLIKNKITNNFAKNKISLLLREITGLDNKQIRLGFAKFKVIYDQAKREFIETFEN